MCLACGKRCDTQVLHGVIVGLWEVQRALFDVEGNEQGRGDDMLGHYRARCSGMNEENIKI